MNTRRLLFLAFSFPLLAMSLTCGKDNLRYSNYGSSPAMLTRVRHLMGPVSTKTQIKAENDLTVSLLSDRWIPIDQNGHPLDGASLVFTPLVNRYRFYLELPELDYPEDSVLFIGETSTHKTPGDPTISGLVLSPPACSASRIFIGSPKTGKYGPVLPVAFVDACRIFYMLGSEGTAWDFQAESTLAARLNPPPTPTPAQ
jgi:hypothetical protein